MADNTYATDKWTEYSEALGPDWTYMGDYNLVAYGGKWINAKEGRVIEVMTPDDLGGDKVLVTAWDVVAPITFVPNDPTDWRSSGHWRMDLKTWRRIYEYADPGKETRRTWTRQARREWQVEAMQSYGCADPVQDYVRGENTWIPEKKHGKDRPHETMERKIIAAAKWYA